MSIGTVSLNTSHKREIPAAPFGPSNILADQGLSLSPTPPAGDVEIQFGDRAGAGTFNSRLTTNRQLDLNGFSIIYDIFGTTLTFPAFENYAIGQNPAVGVHGTTINANYTNVDPTIFGFMGHNVDAGDLGTNSAWLRGANNDNFVFGNTFIANFGLSPAVRFIYFDTGNLTLNSQLGIYPQSDDIDTGIGFQRFPNGGSEAITDPTTGDSIQFFVPGPEIILNTNSAAWSFPIENGEIQVSNLSSNFSITGLNDAGFGGDYIQFNFFNTGAGNHAKMYFTTAGDIIFDKNNAVLPADSGSLAQFYGDVDVNGALNVSTGATGTFTTVDLKTVTVTKGIITSIV